MEFGKVDPALLGAIDFRLPPEPPANKAVLGGTPAAHPRVYTGGARWGCPEWVGTLYPPKTKDKEFLDHYVQHFSNIELNATHYKAYPPDTIAKWAAKAAGRNFKFCPKMLQEITHHGSLVGREMITNEFLNGIAAFGEHLGPIFIQVSDAFDPLRKKELFNYLASLPRHLQFFLEVRHPAWFSDTAIRQELFKTLTKLQIGAVITDTSGRRDCVHMHLTIPAAMVRFVGNNLHPTDYARVDEWVQRIHYWLQNGLQELHFFVHMKDELCVPKMMIYLVDKLNDVCGLNLQKPNFKDTGPTPKPVQGSLF